MYVCSPMDGIQHVSYDILTEQNTAANTQSRQRKVGAERYLCGLQKKAPWQPPKDLLGFYSLVSGFTLLLWVILDKKQCLFAL